MVSPASDRRSDSLRRHPRVRPEGPVRDLRYRPRHRGRRRDAGRAHAGARVGVDSSRGLHSAASPHGHPVMALRERVGQAIHPHHLGHRVLVEELSGARERNSRPTPIKERHPERLFQDAHLERHRRLARHDVLGRAGDAAETGRVAKRAKLLEPIPPWTERPTSGLGTKSLPGFMIHAFIGYLGDASEHINPTAQLPADGRGSGRSAAPTRGLRRATGGCPNRRNRRRRPRARPGRSRARSRSCIPP